MLRDENLCPNFIGISITDHWSLCSNCSQMRRQPRAQQYATWIIMLTLPSSFSASVSFFPSCYSQRQLDRTYAAPLPRHAKLSSEPSLWPMCVLREYYAAMWQRTSFTCNKKLSFSVRTASPCTGWPKIGTFCRLQNFFKFWPIFKLFSLSESGKNGNSTITKDPTTPQVCRYTTLWNVSVHCTSSVIVFEAAMIRLR